MTLNQLPINRCTKVWIADEGEGHDDWLNSKERNKCMTTIAVIQINLDYLVIVALLYQHDLLCNIFTQRHLVRDLD